MSMTQYLTTLIQEKGVSVNDDIDLKSNDGTVHVGLEWIDLIAYIEIAPEYHGQIKTMIVRIDFENGDVFRYLNYLAQGMVDALGY